jgi:hypothetical protein
MKGAKLVYIGTAFALVGVICAAAYLYFFRTPGATAGLRVMTNIPTLVFVNNVQIGTTPVDKLLVPGDAVVKLIPESTASAIPTYQTTVHLSDKIYTTIQRNFGATEADTSGSIVSLLPQPSDSSALSVITSDPDSASVVMDGDPQGFSPLTISSILPTDHRLEITAPGYQPLTISAKSMSGYKLTVTAKLALSSTPPPVVNMLVTPAPATSSATPSATPKTTPKTTPKVTPIITPKASPVPPGEPQVKISDTPTGFLRVRSAPGLNADEIAKVKPGEIYSLLNTKTGWFEISGDFSSTSSGWISSQYAVKL